MNYSFGTDGPDTIIGSDYQADDISGLLGDDVLYAGAGNYSETGDQTAEFLYGEWYEFSNVDAGDDTLVGGTDGYDTLLHGDGYHVAYSTGGDDTLIGGSGGFRNRLMGDAGNLYTSEGGNDTLYGGENTEINYLWGDTIWMWGSCVGGDDHLIAGDNSTNYMWGDAQDAYSSNMGGNDRLESGTGADHMWGDAQNIYGEFSGGADEFVFYQDSGSDFIYDFEKGNDIIEVHMPDILLLPISATALGKLPGGKMTEKALSKIYDDYDFANLKIDVAEGNSVVHFDEGNSVTVVGVTGLTASDFLFI